MPDEPTDVLRGPARSRAGIAVAASPPIAATLIGRTLGRFAITDKLGRGGSGDVFRAEQVGLSRTVVVKVLRRELNATVNRVERFLREAKLASHLDQPLPHALSPASAPSRTACCGSRWSTSRAARSTS